MQEQAFRFGRARHLVGIAGLPSSTAPDAVGVIVLNAGLVHRIGPFRLHVEMTRRLNARGYPTLRFVSIFLPLATALLVASHKPGKNRFARMWPMRCSCSASKRRANASY
jgi:hypothetical protein